MQKLLPLNQDRSRRDGEMATEIHKGPQMVAKFLVDSGRRNSSLGTKSILCGFKVTNRYSDRLTQWSLVSNTETTMNLLGCGMNVNRKKICVCVSEWVWEREGERKSRKGKERLLFKAPSVEPLGGSMHWGFGSCFHSLRYVTVFSWFLSLHSKISEEFKS